MRMHSTKSENWIEEERKEKEIILQRFWNERVLQGNEEAINGIKGGFLYMHPPKGMGRKEWCNKLDELWKRKEIFSDFAQFKALFEHISSLKAVGLYEGFINNRQANEIKSISSAQMQALSQYAQAKNISIAMQIGSTKHDVMQAYCTEDNKLTDVYSMHSVGKVLTGILALQLMRTQDVTGRPIISQEDMAEKPIQLSPSALERLSHAPKVQKKLKEVTLHQALTHHAGLGVGDGAPPGDYLTPYGAKINDCLDSGKQPPRMDNMEDFLEFVPNYVTGNQYCYSNTGMLLGGLSLEYCYNNSPEGKERPLSYNELLSEFVLLEAGMLQTQLNLPQEFKYNQAEKAAQYTAGSPAGGAFTTVADLTKLAKWLYAEYHNPSDQHPSFKYLLEKYGQEFYHNGIIEHRGDAPSGSAYLRIDFKTGNMVIALNGQKDGLAAELGYAVNDKIFSKEIGTNTLAIHQSLGTTPAANIEVEKENKIEVKETLSESHSQEINVEPEIKLNNSKTEEALPEKRSDIRKLK